MISLHSSNKASQAGRSALQSVAWAIAFDSLPFIGIFDKSLLDALREPTFFSWSRPSEFVINSAALNFDARSSAANFSLSCRISILGSAVDGKPDCISFILCITIVN